MRTYRVIHKPSGGLWLDALEFRECDGCGAPTGLAEYKPKRLCDDCEMMALWAQPGDVVVHLATGARGQVLAEPHETVQVLTASGIEEWRVMEARRLAIDPEEPKYSPERRIS